MIPYGKQDISQQDIEAVIEVLQSDFLTQGPNVPAFENALTSNVGAKHALAMNSATSALHAACLALGLGKGDRLWTTPVTFVASANAGLYCGAKIDFVDIDPETYNMCPKQLEKKLIEAQLKGTLPKVLVPVHLCGQSCDMRAIQHLCMEYDVKIIEDASHAIGGSYLGGPIGNCAYSDITVFSFHPVKIVTTGEGGAALTNDDQLAEKMALYRGHGITRDQNMMTEPSHGSWYYQQIELGYNYRMTDIQAALGISQMHRLSEFVSKRHQIALRYNVLLEGLPVEVPFQLDDTYSGLHLYVIRLKLDDIQRSHKHIFEGLREKGIGVNVHYIPVHLQPHYSAMGFQLGDFPESEKYYSEAISLPMYPNLSEDDQDRVIEVLTSLLVSK
ncbi:UDP-4-amino-4,6-dideoxy-N-acetyl-beta-L-altrosamine transaminase [Candidatus Njordibacter sp. Uisw_056]|uniref:UDP-4-amino-4, 6-dideoxy-N-acetyl-beta-L-altrosamine transaminase n=1 Tax=Candidatus Njordibacter sp. Uisw_056 TaxID=3230973 RepID=UPI003D4E4643